MDIATYAVEAEIERDHWWFVGRRRLFSSVIGSLGLDREADILDIGTSTGTNLRMLRDLDFRRVTGLDSSEVAVKFCSEKGLGAVELGDACNLPFEPDRFELVLATDVIEHVDDVAALREIARVLAPGGYALISVPTFMALWGLQDDVAHHKRRYLKGEVVEKVRQAGLRVQTAYYFNFVLFVPIWIARRIIRVMGIKLNSENQVNSPLINSILTAVFAADIRLAPRLKMPFGVSALVVARKAAP